MGKRKENLSVVAKADLTLTHQDDVGFVIAGEMEAHHSSFLGTQKGQRIEIGGNLYLTRGNGPGDTVNVSIVAGGITLDGKMTVSGLTAEQILFLRGRGMPAASLAGVSER